MIFPSTGKRMFIWGRVRRLPVVIRPRRWEIKLAFALQPGIDYVVPGGSTVLFGNAIIAFDAYRNGGGTAVSVQGGVGLQF